MSVIINLACTITLIFIGQALLFIFLPYPFSAIGMLALCGPLSACFLGIRNEHKKLEKMK